MVLKCLRVLFVLCLYASAPLCSAQGTATSSAPNPGITPPAPPPVSGATVLVAGCFALSETTSQFGGSATGQLLYSTTTGVDRTTTLNCPPPAPIRGLYPKMEVPVWTADDSKAHFDFLRAEVKRTIETAVMDKVVKSDVIQNAVSKAMLDQTALQDAVDKAVDRALSEKLPALQAQMKAEILKELKAEKTNSASSTSPQQ